MIGVFDSGVGGLTVAKEIMKELPQYDLIYFGDTARAPYGNKSKETIVRYALEDADFLIKKGAKMIVIACNTASAYAFEALKEKYPDMPIFEVITPAAEEAAAMTRSGRIGIIGTRATIKSGIYEEKLKIVLSSRAERSEVEGSHNPNNATGEISPLAMLGRNDKMIVFPAACPLFVPLIEEGWIKTPEIKMIARKYLSVFKNKNIDTLILGCTHYPIIKNIIQEKVGRRVRLIDSAGAVTKKIKEFITTDKKELSKNGEAKFFMSDVTEQNQKIANKFLGKNIILYESGDIE